MVLHFLQRFPSLTTRFSSPAKGLKAFLSAGCFNRGLSVVTSCAIALDFVYQHVVVRLRVKIMAAYGSRIISIGSLIGYKSK
jgi:hypothetical protein